MSLFRLSAKRTLPATGGSFLCEGDFCLQELPEHQQDDAGDAQEADEQGGDEIDLEDDAGVGGDQIQQPQADKAGQGVDDDLPQASDLGEEELQHQDADHNGNEQRENIFHGFLHTVTFAVISIAHDNREIQ